MAPRATRIKEQGFSEAVAARIEAPQRSIRSVYEAKWAIFTKWCVTNPVDFRSPPVKSVADFLLYLFEDKKLQPSTIDGYRSAIADKLGNATVNISKDDNLTHLLESFHRDRPKGRRGIPSWNLSLVLHQLTKAPFEPLREASLKHLTFKTVFLLENSDVLPSGGLFLLKGLNSALSAPTVEQVCKKRGGGSRFGPFNRSLLTDCSPKGFLTSGSTRARRELLVYSMSSSKSLVTYPPTKR